MRSFVASLAALMTVTALQVAHGQAPESAPQEPPYTQEENEFDTAPLSAPTTSEVTSPKVEQPSAPEDEVLSIEDEIKAAEPKKEEGAVNLNEKVPAAGPATPVPVEENALSEEEPDVIPVTPVLEVKPLQQAKPSEAVRQSPKGGVEYIQHPQAAKGLLRIEKDGTYIYKTKEDASFSKTGTLRFGTMDAPKITSKDGATNFETMYHGSPVPVVIFDYEWQPFTSFGRLGVQAGVAFLVSQGSGRFACDNCGSLNGTEAKEKYTFVAAPLSVGGIYRLEWLSHQWVAPYVSGGGTYVPVVELRDDNSSPHGVGTPGVYGAGGMMFNISALDHDTAFTLRNEYGISNLWVSAEYRYLKTFNEELDFTSSIVTLGIGIDY